MSDVAIVTGGAGFLGSHICDRLLAQGLDVISVDNYMTGRRSNLDRRVTQLAYDVVELYQYEMLKQLKGRDLRYVFNFACPASPPKYQLDPVHTMMTCVVGTNNGLDLARLTKATFIQASTSEVYGDPTVHPQVESYRGSVNTFGPRACYDEGKRAAESLCFDYVKQYKAPVRVVRIFNTYGPRMDADDGRVVTNFINQALRGEDITIYGDGSQTRSFCYVDDLIDGIMKLADSTVAIRPVNIGNPVEFTVMELAKKVIELTGSKSKIVTKDLPQDDPSRRCPNISVAQSLLQWEPSIPLVTGLERTIDYFRKERGTK